MNKIFFPSQYKKALLAGTKNTTIRIKSECGKYTTGKSYRATSYAGRDWGIRVKIVKIIKTTLGELSEFGIPARSIKAIQKRGKIALNENVELLRFTVI